jgi:hypothetical protein
MRSFNDGWRTADIAGALGITSMLRGGLMHISYVKLFRDDEGVVRDTQEANGEFRLLHLQIEQLKYALEMEMDTVSDLRELLDTVRRIAYELNEEILKDNNDTDSGICWL